MIDSNITIDQLRQWEEQEASLSTRADAVARDHQLNAVETRIVLALANGNGWSDAVALQYWRSGAIRICDQQTGAVIPPPRRRA